MSLRRNEASPNGKRPLMTKNNSPDVSVEMTLLPEDYANDGYVGSKAKIVKSIDDSKDEIEIMVDNGLVKSGLDQDSDTSSQEGEDKSSCAFIEKWQFKLDDFYAEHKKKLTWTCYILLLIGYLAYFIWALVLDFHRAVPLFVITMLVIAGTIYTLVRDRFGQSIYKALLLPISNRIESIWYILKWIVYVGIIISIAVFLGLTVGPRPKQYISIGGLAFFFAMLFVFSKHPSKVNWRPVLWGLGLNFLFAVLILKWSYGYMAFKFLGAEISKFLSYSDVGAEFVFGKKYKDHFFAFKVLPVIVFFSCAISTLYHLGAMQAIISKIAWLMQVTMSTAPTESLSCAGNIFVGQTEAPILIRPFLEKMTKSELHAVMTGGYATIAGGVLAAYILFGVPAEHLLCASVMNAPVALAVSKLFYPETEVAQIRNTKDIKVEGSKSNNILEAASTGASASIGLVANIAANLIAFLAMLAFINATLSWLGSMVGHPELTFQLICSYVFMPIAFLMGVDWEDCGIVAELLGMKTFLNEFVAYEELSKYIKNRDNCAYPQISRRSEIITTYALCGFANLSSVGIQLGGIGPMAPSRASDLAKLAVRALIAGTVACFITACVAGILVIEEPETSCVFNSTINGTVLPPSGTTYTSLLDLVTYSVNAANATGLGS